MDSLGNKDSAKGPAKHALLQSPPQKTPEMLLSFWHS